MDKLISLQNVIEILENKRFETGKDLAKSYLLADVQEQIERLPADFDKEKVIDKLVELRQKEYNDNEEVEDLTDGEEIYDAGRSQGRFEAYHKAIEIVEKGGIE